VREARAEEAEARRRQADAEHALRQEREKARRKKEKDSRRRPGAPEGGRGRGLPCGERDNRATRLRSYIVMRGRVADCVGWISMRVLQLPSGSLLLASICVRRSGSAFAPQTVGSCDSTVRFRETCFFIRHQVVYLHPARPLPQRQWRPWQLPEAEARLRQRDRLVRGPIA